MIKRQFKNEFAENNSVFDRDRAVLFLKEKQVYMEMFEDKMVDDLKEYFINYKEDLDKEPINTSYKRHDGEYFQRFHQHKAQGRKERVKMAQLITIDYLKIKEYKLDKMKSNFENYRNLYLPDFVNIERLRDEFPRSKFIEKDNLIFLYISYDYGYMVMTIVDIIGLVFDLTSWTEAIAKADEIFKWNEEVYKLKKQIQRKHDHNLAAIDVDSTLNKILSNNNLYIYSSMLEEEEESFLDANRTEDGEPFFFASRVSISNRTGVSKTTAQTTLNYLCFLGLIEKVHYDEISSQKSFTINKNNKFNKVNLYKIPKITKKKIEEVEKMQEIYKTNKITKNTLTRGYLRDNFPEYYDKVFYKE